MCLLFQWQKAESRGTVAFAADFCQSVARRSLSLPLSRVPLWCLLYTPFVAFLPLGESKVRLKFGRANVRQPPSCMLRGDSLVTELVRLGVSSGKLYTLTPWHYRTE